MNTTAAKTSIKNLMQEAASLEPAALIHLYEIDIENIAFENGIVVAESEKIFRFHNNVKLLGTSLFWKGKEYIAAPVEGEGFELTTKGAIPTPKLRLSTAENGIFLLSVLKDKLRQLGDLVGAKVTRIKTFAKYLDARNFQNSTPPKGFAPDPNSEFFRDIYYIDRKSQETRGVIEFELAGLLDVENVKLPGRLVVSNKCPFFYRGIGCCYEYASRRKDLHDNAILPTLAPPIANDRDELIKDILGVSQINDRGEWSAIQTYYVGDSIYIVKDDINYYFVAQKENIGVIPPDDENWIADQCSKSVPGCVLRYGANGSASGGIVKGNLRYGGYSAVARVR